MTALTSNELVIAVDAGGTKTIAAIATSQGKVVSSKEGCGNSATLGLVNASSVILSAIRGALRQCGYSAFVDMLEGLAEPDAAMMTPPPSEEDIDFLAPLTPKIKAIWIGSAGLASLSDVTAYRSQLHFVLTKNQLLLPDTALWVTNDAVLLSAPMLRDDSSNCCVCLIAGTGSAGFAFQRNTQPAGGESKVVTSLQSEVQDLPGLTTVSKTGGWGYLLGDPGSGWSIGLSTVRLLLHRQEARQFDQLPLTHFEQAVCSSLGVGRPAEIIPATYEDRLASLGCTTGNSQRVGSFSDAEDVRKRWLAEISKVVFQYAFRSDLSDPTSGADLARGLVDQATDECAKAVRILCSPMMKMATEGVTTLVLGGGLWHDTDFLDCFVRLCEADPSIVKFKTVCAIASPVDEVVQYLRETFLA